MTARWISLAALGLALAGSVHAAGPGSRPGNDVSNVGATREPTRTRVEFRMDRPNVAPKGDLRADIVDNLRDTTYREPRR